MKFEISRASISEDGDPEVPGAYKESHIPYEGSDEVVEWYIDINTLEELVNLCKEVGDDLIFNRSSICVYDDYIE